jgi:hypothetical protein
LAFEDFWKGFDSPRFPDSFNIGASSNLAQKVLSTYGIPFGGGATAGGNLPGLDIKHMDAVQVIKLCLLESSAKSGTFYEIIVNPKGEVEFIEIGQGEGPSDIYYEIQSSTYKDACSGVMITGRDPMAYRKGTSWRNALVGKEIHDCGFLYHDSCQDPSFNQYCVILYNDPQFDSTYNDGIDNLYNVNSPWETITGYASYMEWDDWESDSDTTITRLDTAKVILEMPTELGILRKRPTAEATTWGFDPNCFDGPSSVDADGGVEVEIPSSWRYTSVRSTRVDKFMGVVAVYVLGWVADSIKGPPISNTAADTDEPSSEDAKIILSIKQTSPKIIKLMEGQQYVVAYEGNSPVTPYIVFADNTQPGEVYDLSQGPVDYEIDPHCGYAAKKRALGGELKGTGLLLPHEPGKCIKVEQVFVGIELETPAILVFNPEGSTNKAREIAESVRYQLKPIVTVDEPPPIAFNGGFINLDSSVADHDPTTTQSFLDTAMETALTAMDAGGGMTLSLSFLDGGDCAALSGALKEHLDKGSGIETTYVCGPNCEAELGATGPNGGIVNSISYSYQDSNSYTISVNCGELITGGFAQAGSGITFRASESYSAKGTVVQDQGDHAYFKVRVDGYGEVTAINMCPQVIRVGDKVNVTIHNVPVEG